MHVSWKQHAITECSRMKNSAKQIKCLGFLGKNNVWKIPTYFQKQGKQIVNLYTFLFIRQTCTSVWFDNAQSTNQVKKLIQVFPVTALLAFSNSPSHRSSRNSTRHLLGGMVLLLKCLLFFFRRQIIDCSQERFSFCLYYTCNILLYLLYQVNPTQFMLLICVFWKLGLEDYQISMEFLQNTLQLSSLQNTSIVLPTFISL